MSRAWVDIEPSSTRFRRAIRDHVSADGEQLQALASQFEPATAEMALDLLEDARAALGEAIACAGLHLRDARAVVAAGGFFAEVAALAGRPFSVEFSDADHVCLPLSGIEIRARSRGPVRLSTTDYAVSISIAENSMLIDYTAGEALFEASALGTIAKPDSYHGMRVLPRYRFLDTVIFGDRIDPNELGAAGSVQLAGALDWLKSSDPLVWDEMSDFRLNIVPVVPRDTNTKRISWSDRRARNTVFLGVTSFEDSAELLVHEYAHLKLCLLQETFDLLEEHRLPALAPWRRDARTAEGLVHGIYAFHMVVSAFERIQERASLSSQLSRRFVIWTACIEAGIEQLTVAGAELTMIGRLLIGSIGDRNSRRTDELGRSSARMLDWARRVVQEHLDQAGQPGSRGPWFLAL